MYLLDTNIFLEILLSQKKCTDCKKLLNDKICNIFISDFSLHSIGIILFQNDKEDIFANFISDVAARIEIVSLLSESYTFLSEFKEKYGLDFDDAYSM